MRCLDNHVQRLQIAGVWSYPMRPATILAQEISASPIMVQLTVGDSNSGLDSLLDHELLVGSQVVGNADWPITAEASRERSLKAKVSQTSTKILSSEKFMQN